MKKKALERLGLTSAYVSQPAAPQLIGKREAEKFIYAITIAAWLALPALEIPYSKLGLRFWKFYFPVAALIAISTLLSLFARGEPKSKKQLSS